MKITTNAGIIWEVSLPEIYKMLAYPESVNYEGGDYRVLCKWQLAGKDLVAIIIGYDRFFLNEDGTVSGGFNAPKQYYVEVMPYDDEGLLGEEAWKCHWFGEEGPHDPLEISQLCDELLETATKGVDKWISEQPDVYEVLCLSEYGEGGGTSVITELFNFEAQAREYFSLMVNKEKTDEDFSWVARYFNGKADIGEIVVTDKDTIFSASDKWGNSVTWQIIRKIIL